MSQRWVKLPNGGYVDANRVAYVGRVDAFPTLDDDGNDLPPQFQVVLGTDFLRDSQISITGSKEEIGGMIRSVLGIAP